MKHKLNDKLKFLLITSLAVVVIMALLQPFNTNNVKEYKWLVIAGYGIMTFIGCAISDFITTHIFGLSWDTPSIHPLWNKRDFVLTVLNIPILAVLISCYDAIVLEGSIHKAWFYPDGTFTFTIFGRYCLYVAAISVFMFLFWIYRNRNRALLINLQEAVELNRMLAEKQNAFPASEKAKKETGQRKIIRGTTKEYVELQPEDLLYIEAEGNYANIVYLTDGKATRKTLRCTMKQMEEAFDDCPQIIRCHRAFLVNTTQIVHLAGNSKGFQLTLNGIEQKVPVSKTYAQEIRHLMENRT